MKAAPRETKVTQDTGARKSSPCHSIVADRDDFHHESGAPFHSSLHLPRSACAPSWRRSCLRRWLKCDPLAKSSRTLFVIPFATTRYADGRRDGRGAAPARTTLRSHPLLYSIKHEILPVCRILRVNIISTSSSKSSARCPDPPVTHSSHVQEHIADWL